VLRLRLAACISGRGAAVSAESAIHDHRRADRLDKRGREPWPMWIGASRDLN
jgi:hypothetical protein